VTERRLTDPGFNLLDLPLVHRATHVALMSHQGDRNKHDGEFYLLHCHRVAFLVEQAGGDEVQIAIAWLHDTVEDTKTTIEDIAFLFADYPRVVAGVKAITKIGSEPHEVTLERIAANFDASFVKFYGDTMDNVRRNYLIVDESRAARLAKKYTKNLSRLAFVQWTNRKKAKEANKKRKKKG
jgi:(p)ppGpp synthase/HD superfamily hydrolase